jgi:hypothetical protein
LWGVPEAIEIGHESDAPYMMVVLLVVASIIDATLAVLLIVISGFIFGDGPEGMGGAISGAIPWSVGFVGSIVAPVAGFLLRRAGKAGIGVAVAFMPPVVTLAILMI